MLKRVLMAMAIALSASAAQADKITFESITPDTTFFFPNETFEDSGYRMTVLGDFGFVDVAAALAEPLLGNATKFYQAFNDGFLSIARTDDQPFRLDGFDAGFIAPFNVGAGVVAGRIFALGTTLSGGTVLGSWELGSSDANGNFSFQSFGGTAGFSAFSAVTSLQFAACIYDANFACSNPADNLGQFALDNVSVVVVPEPSTYALMALGMAGLAWRARRSRR